MQWHRVITDEELIERMRRRDRHRVRSGLLTVAGGVAMLLLTSGMFTWFLYQWAPFSDTGPGSARVNFVSGLVLGALLAGTAHYGSHIIAQGLATALVRNRRDRLLLQLWDDARREEFV